MMTGKLSEAALGIVDPRAVNSVEFNDAATVCRVTSSLVLFSRYPGMRGSVSHMGTSVANVQRRPCVMGDSVATGRTAAGIVK